MNQYQPGDAVRCSVEFRNLDGTLADPSTVVAKYRNGTGAVTTKTYGSDAEVVRDATGLYHIDISPDAAGTWYYRFAGTGTVIAAVERSFRVTTNF